MTWSGFWAPFLVQAVLGGAISAAVGVVVAFLLKRFLRGAFGDLLDQLLRTSEDARQGSISAGQAAQDASQSVQATAEVKRRISSLEQATQAWRDDVSASLAHRMRDDLRSRGVQQQLEQLNRPRSEP